MFILTINNIISIYTMSLSYSRTDDGTPIATRNYIHKTRDKVVYLDKTNAVTEIKPEEINDDVVYRYYGYSRVRSKIQMMKKKEELASNLTKNHLLELATLNINEYTSEFYPLPNFNPQGREYIRIAGGAG